MKWKERKLSFSKKVKRTATRFSGWCLLRGLLIQGIGGFWCFVPGNCYKLYPVCKLFLSKQTRLNRVSEWPSARRSSETGNNCWLLKNAQCAHLEKTTSNIKYSGFQVQNNTSEMESRGWQFEWTSQTAQQVLYLALPGISCPFPPSFQ